MIVIASRAPNGVIATGHNDGESPLPASDLAAY
jgi:hypothetical protein